jgi:hypothetical protein
VRTRRWCYALRLRRFVVAFARPRPVPAGFSIALATVSTAAAPASRTCPTFSSVSPTAIARRAAPCVFFATEVAIFGALFTAFRAVFVTALAARPVAFFTALAALEAVFVRRLVAFFVFFTRAVLRGAKRNLPLCTKALTAIYPSLGILNRLRGLGRVGRFRFRVYVACTATAVPTKQERRRSNGQW